eukprot:357750-Hanusia_phi.AAC.2
MLFDISQEQLLTDLPRKLPARLGVTEDSHLHELEVAVVLTRHLPLELLQPRKEHLERLHVLLQVAQLLFRRRVCDKRAAVPPLLPAQEEGSPPAEEHSHGGAAVDILVSGSALDDQPVDEAGRKRAIHDLHAHMHARRVLDRILVLVHEVGDDAWTQQLLAGRRRGIGKVTGGWEEVREIAAAEEGDRLLDVDGSPLARALQPEVSSWPAGVLRP